MNHYQMSTLIEYVLKLEQDSLCIILNAADLEVGTDEMAVAETYKNPVP